MSKSVICTIIAKNYLAHARCLTDSFLEHHPDGQVFVLVVDEFEGYFDPSQERFTTIGIDEIGIKDWVVMTYRYTVLELSTAVKPFLLEYLFRHLGCKKVCYFDPDIYFYESINDIWNLLDSHGMVLTPHLLDFLDDEFWPSELNILQSGSYNLGFIGLSQNQDLYRFLHWWQRKMVKYCIVDIDNGLFVDQKWIDLAPSFFSNVFIHRNPGCNVAYWNLNHRYVECQSGKYTVNDVPLKFFHFSGFSPSNPDVLSKYQDRFTFRDLPAVKPLFATYCDCLLGHGYETAKQWPYTYDYYNALGVRIPDAARVLLKDWEPDNLLESFDATSHDKFITRFLFWLNEHFDEESPTWPVLTRLALAVYQQRPDLQVAYPDVLGKDRQQYARWFLSRAEVELDMDDFFIDPMRSQQATHIGDKQWLVRGLRNLVARFYRSFADWLFRIGAGPWLEQKLGSRFINRVRNLFTQPDRKQPVISKPVPSLTLPNLKKTSFGLNVVGYLCDETGVGEVARSSLKALHSQGFPVAYTMALSHASRKNDHSVLHLPEGHQYALNCIYVNADQAEIVYNELGPEFFAGKYNIAYWHWELSRFPEEWLNRFQYFDEIWVASSFAQSALARVSPIPVLTIGAPVEKHPNEGVTRSQLGVPEDRFLFLFVFDMLSYIERKNPFGVIEAYRSAFGFKSQETTLVIKVANLDQYPQYRESLEEAVKSVSGILIDRYLDRKDLNGLFHAADAYISLHRSEGFGLTIAEAMRLGKPAIATAYSSTIDYMNVTNSYPVGYRLIELENDYGPYKKGEIWADPDLDHAAAQMQRVFENPDEASRIGAQAASDIQRLYSNDVIARKIIERLNTIFSYFQ